MAILAMNHKTVATEHPDYTAHKAQWKRCRDAVAGQDALRDAGIDYLPKLTEQTPESYESYKKRATFFNATSRTISGLVGMLFRKPEAVDVPAGIEAFLDDVTLSGEPAHIFANQCALELFTVGRVGVLTDYPVVDEPGALTRARAESLGLRPVLARYTAESIINWKTGPINNVVQLLQVVLVETVAEGGDEFAPVMVKQYRVLDLAPNPAAKDALAYRIRVFRIDKETDTQYQVGADRFPLMAGKPLTTIPFEFFAIDALTPCVKRPPLLDLVDVNLAHWCVSADYEHGCHFTGLPTPYVAGYQPADPTAKLYIGSTAAWIFQDPATKVGFLEFTGAGLTSLVENLDRKEAQMAAIGARLLAAEKKGVEAAETANIRHSGETAILSASALVLSLGLTKALRVFAAWANVDGDVKFDINRDFFPAPMDAQTLTALVGAWQAGAISFETLFENLQRGEVIAQTSEFEKEQAKIDNAAPKSTSTPTNSARMTTKMVADKQATVE